MNVGIAIETEDYIIIYPAYPELQDEYIQVGIVSSSVNDYSWPLLMHTSEEVPCSLFAIDFPHALSGEGDVFDSDDSFIATLTLDSGAVCKIRVYGEWEE